MNSHWVPSCEGVNLITDNPFIYTTLACQRRSHMLQWITDRNHALLEFLMNFTGYFALWGRDGYVTCINVFHTFQKCVLWISTMHTQWCCPITNAHNNRNIPYFVSSEFFKSSATSNETSVGIVCSHSPDPL